MSETTHRNDGLIFTDAAARKVGELIREEGNPKLKLRVFVSGGGCSGFQYGFTFDEKIEDGDAEFPNQGVTLLVDPLSFQYLAGAEIDYREDLEGAQFVIRNPNATTTCGCGSSFSTGEKEKKGTLPDFRGGNRGASPLCSSGRRCRRCSASRSRPVRPASTARLGARGAGWSAP
ncbi:MAG TPA: iron-sulfur cluster insertion protein ErpA [Bryobacteraceae bacterium]|nr:iron-sulfur cluster insertion protein ErpA [Bryobacteraceae bacterium]